MSASIRLRAHAKLTLSLRVRPRRPDGYHEIDAVMVSLEEPADVVEIELTEGPGVELRVGGAVAGVPTDAANLAWQAASALLAEAGRGAGARVRLVKCIPPRAGLGGGSADAAAVLTGLATLLGDDLGEVDLAALGAGLSSDVPFCLRGGAARVRGAGEIVEPLELPERARVPLVVAVPPFGLDTAEVYRAWDELGGPAADRMVPAPGGLGLLVDALVNDLEPAAEHVEPRLAEFRRRLETSVGRAAVLAGSGSAYAVAMPLDAPADAPGAGAVVLWRTTCTGRGVSIDEQE